MGCSLSVEQKERNNNINRINHIEDLIKETVEQWMIESYIYQEEYTDDYNKKSIDLTLPDFDHGLFRLTNELLIEHILKQRPYERITLQIAEYSNYLSCVCVYSEHRDIEYIVTVYYGAKPKIRLESNFSSRNSANNSSSNSSSSDSSSSSTSSSDYSKKERPDLRKPSAIVKDEDGKVDLSCKICTEYKANTLLVPCHHIVACSICAVKLETCPTCRGEIKEIVNIIVS